MGVLADGKVVIETGLDSSGIEKGLGKLGGLVKTGLSAAVGVIAGVSTALVGAGIASVKFGSDFESSLAKASTLFGDVNVNADNLNSKILELSGSSGVAASEIGNSLYNALSAGIPVTEDMGTAMTYMEQCTKLAKAGFTDVDTVVTSTAKVLNAYKMDVDQTDKVHKILMQTQNKGITTVGELGASLAQVTPTAAAMNVSFEQVGAALATMTAQGTPTAQATTQLNSLFAELGKQGTVASKSLEKATEGTKYAGKGFSDLMAEGVPLNEVLDLMGVSAGMSDQSLIDMFGSIEAGKAALAMSGKNAEQYTTNLKEMSTQTDVVGDAYEKVSDTFAEKSKKMIENAKNLGIAVYRGMEAPLKQMAESGIDAISQLSSAFETGGLQGLVEEAGSIFADIAVKAAEQAPKMVDAAVGVIQSFVDGIIANKDRLYTAAVDIVKTLAGGVAELLPRSMGEPVKAAVDEIAKSFEDGGLKSAVGSFTTLLTNVGKVAGNVGKVFLPPLTKALDLCGDNLDILVPLLVAGYTAFKGYTVVKTVVSSVSAMAKSFKAASVMLANYEIQQIAATFTGRTYNGVLTAGQAVVGVLTGKITLATGATAALNAVMSALGGPIGIALTAGVALAAGIGALALVTDTASEAEKKHAEEIKKQEEAWKAQKEVTDERKKSYDDFSTTQNKQAAADIQQTQNLQSLNTELKSIVDENGNVKEGEENRAAFITSKLSEALGIEIQLTDGQIQNYQELQGEIQNLIEQKRIEAVLSAQEAKYKEAVNNQMEAAAEAQKNLASVTKAKNSVDKEEVELSKLKSERAAFQAEGNTELVRSYNTLIEQQEKEVESAQKNLDKKEETYNKSTAILAQYASDIDMYTALAEAAASGNGAAIEEAIVQITFGIKTASVATNQELQAQVKQVSDFEQYIRDEVQKGTTGFRQDMIDQASSATKAAVEEMAKAAPQSAEEISKIPPAVIAALVAGNLKGELSSEASGAVEGMIKQFDNLDADTKEAFSQVIYGALEGLAGFEQVKDPAKEGADAFLQSLKEVLEIHSPSAAVAEIFSYVWPGATEGLKKGREEPLAEVGNFVTEFLGLFGETGLGQALGGIGSTAMSLFGIGVSSQTGNSLDAGQQNALAAGAGAGSVNPSGIGSLFASLFGGGISGGSDILSSAGTLIAGSAQSGASVVNPNGVGVTFGNLLRGGIAGTAGILRSAGNTIANSAQSGAGGVNPSPVGKLFGTLFSGGVGSQSNNALSGGKSLSSAADRGARSDNGSGSGSFFGGGFASGIRSMVSSAVDAAKSLASSALSAIKNVLDINSPSKKTTKLGAFAGQGIAVGMEGETSRVKNASSKLANVALNGLDIGAIAEKMRNTVAMESAKMSAAITATVNFKVSGAVEAEKQNQSKLMDELAEKIADKLCTKGFGVQCNGREIGRLVGEFAR